MKSLLSSLPGASFRHRISHLNAAWLQHNTHTHIYIYGGEAYPDIYSSPFHSDVGMMLFAYANTSLQCLCHLFAIHEIECYCGYTKMIAAILWGSALLQWKPGEAPERSVIRAKEMAVYFYITITPRWSFIKEISQMHRPAMNVLIYMQCFVAVQETKHADFPVNRLNHCTSMTLLPPPVILSWLTSWQESD